MSRGGKRRWEYTSRFMYVKLNDVMKSVLSHTFLYVPRVVLIKYIKVCGGATRARVTVSGVPAVVFSVGVSAELLKHGAKAHRAVGVHEERGAAAPAEGGHSRRRAADGQRDHRHRGQEAARKGAPRLLHHAEALQRLPHAVDKPESKRKVFK